MANVSLACLLLSTLSSVVWLSIYWDTSRPCTSKFFFVLFFLYLLSLQFSFRALLTGLFLTHFFPVAKLLTRKWSKKLHDVILPWGGQQSLQVYEPYNIHLTPTLTQIKKFEVVMDLYLPKHSPYASSVFLPLYCVSLSNVWSSCQ